MVDIKLNLPSSFYDEEERDGYMISKSRKELWAILLDMMLEVDRVCRKYDIKYFLDSGTLLGAVRHHGFIPWDDDVDLIMTRENYNKFLEIGPFEFKHPYFLQNAYTDIDYVHGHSQLRRSDTCGILRGDYEKHVKFNLGIFIDIFVVDGIPNKKIQRYFFDKKIILYTNGLNNKKDFIYHHINLSKILKYRRYDLIKKYGTLRNTFRAFEQYAQRYRKSNYVSKVMFNNKYHLKREWLLDTEYIKFEDFSLPIPKEYSNILKVYYGSDYMIPKVAPSMHGEVILDTNRTYTEILKEIEKKNGIIA